MKRGFKRTVAVFLAVLMLASTVVMSFAASDKIKSGTAQNAEKIAKQIEAEGIVMLKNEDGSLPLKNKKVNVFGMGSVAFAIGGGGSGSVTSDNAIDFYAALKNAGIEYNTELLDVYKNYQSKNSVKETGQGLIDMLVQMVNGKLQKEMPISSINSKVMKNAQEFSENAIFVITRTGAEMSDVSIKDIKISDEERKIISELDSKFDNVIIVFNTCNILQMDWLNSYENVNAALLCWTPGEVGADSIGRVLTGEINPSGKLPDTVAYTIEDYPTTVNFGNFAYKDAPISFFVNYEEDIYVGYRYFETFCPDRVMFPFGYGLSYTNFEWTVKNFNANENKISMTVEVKNTGSVPGKDVVELYFSAPYYGSIQKSAIELAGYKKTKEIAPGKTDTVTIEFDTKDMASYDMDRYQAWVLEAGNYQIKLGKDVQNIVSTYTYRVPETKIYKNDDTTGTEIKNLFSEANGGLNYLSRENLLSRTSAPSSSDYLAPDSVKYCDTRPAPTTEGTIYKTGVKYADGDIMLADVAADPTLWEKFLDQFTVDEMINLIAESGYKTAGLDRLGVPVTVDNDGPAMVKGSGGLLYKDSGLAYPVTFALACTWNDELAEAFGDSIGQEANDIGTNVWYAPGCNLHRNPMGGRNFEYYSEDPLLSGKMAAAVTRGVQKHNVVVTVKHFVCNDQETNRQTRGVFTWTNEQALRELYLEPFEIAVKEGKAKGIMSAYNRLGANWCSGYPTLINDLLRKEWGFDGFVVSDAYIDFTGNGYMDPVLAVYARNDALLTSLWYFAEKLQITGNMKAVYKKDPVAFGKMLRYCTYDLCRLKMQTNAFDASKTTGHKGLSVIGAESDTLLEELKNDGFDTSKVKVAGADELKDSEKVSKENENKKTSSETATTVTATQPADEAATPEKKSSKTVPIVIGVVVTLAVAGGVTGGVVYKKKKK